MSANFTPNYSNLKETSSFSFWCQKVLPLVYDDSLSYYETLCKIANYLNDVIRNVDTTDENVRSIRDAYVMLENYVNNYFNDINVQNIVNEEIKNMIERDEIDVLDRRRFILLSDSWGGYFIDGVNYSWVNDVKNNIKTTYGENNIYALSLGGIGFVYNSTIGTFKTLLESANIDNANTITDIVVCGGTNDMVGLHMYGVTTDVIESSIREFIEYCKSKFPNAVVRVGCIGNYYNSRNSVNAVRKAYKTCVKYGGTYITNSEWICDSARFIDSSGIHPTVEGFKNLGYYLTKAVVGCDINVAYDEYDTTYHSVSTKFTGVNFTPISYKQNNGMYYIGCRLTGVAFSYPQGKGEYVNNLINGEHELMRFNDYQLFSTNFTVCGDVPMYFSMGDGNFVGFRGTVKCANNVLKYTINVGTINNPNNTDLSSVRILNVGFMNYANPIFEYHNNI